MKKNPDRASCVGTAPAAFESSKVAHPSGHPTSLPSKVVRTGPHGPDEGTSPSDPRMYCVNGRGWRSCAT